MGRGGIKLPIGFILHINAQPARTGTSYHPFKPSQNQK